MFALKILSSVSMFTLTGRGFACPDSDILSFSCWQNRTFYLVCKISESITEKLHNFFSIWHWQVFWVWSWRYVHFTLNCLTSFVTSLILLEILFLSRVWLDERGILKLKQFYMEDYPMLSDILLWAILKMKILH